MDRASDFVVTWDASGYTTGYAASVAIYGFNEWFNGPSVRCVVPAQAGKITLPAVLLQSLPTGVGSYQLQVVIVPRPSARLRYQAGYKRARQQIDHELNVIEKLNLAGYFLIVWDIVNFCREEGILVQGRGSAANSAVCYSLGITAVDPVGMGLLFERF